MSWVRTPWPPRLACSPRFIVCQPCARCVRGSNSTPCWSSWQRPLAVVCDLEPRINEPYLVVIAHKPGVPTHASGGKRVAGRMPMHLGSHSQVFAACVTGSHNDYQDLRHRAAWRALASGICGTRWSCLAGPKPLRLLKSSNHNYQSM
jgi:hypothetical protein